MSFFMEWMGLIIGIVGWVATSFLISRSDRINIIQKHAITVLAWIVWMFPAFETLVRRNLLHSDAAMNYCGWLTVFLALVVFISAMRTRARS